MPELVGCARLTQHASMFMGIRQKTHESQRKATQQRPQLPHIALSCRSQDELTCGQTQVQSRGAEDV